MSDKQKILAFVGVFALVFVGEGAFAYRYIAEIGEHNETVQRLEQEELDAERKIQQIPNLVSKAEDLANIIEEYAQILPNEKEVRFDAFLEDIDGFTHDADVRIMNATPEKVVDPSKRKAKNKKKKGRIKDKRAFVRHKYRFKLEGTFLGFLRFVNKIENHPRFLRIDEFSIEPVEKKKSGEVESAENPLKAIELVVSTYTYSKETPSAKQPKEK